MVEGLAIVDTGSLMSVVDEELGEKLQLTYTGRFVKLTTLSGEEVTCREALSITLTLEDEKLISERVTIYRLPSNIKEKLRAMDVHDQVIIGVLTLEAAGFVINPKTGKLEKIGWLAIQYIPLQTTTL